MKKRLFALFVIGITITTCLLFAWTVNAAESRDKISLKGASPWGETHRNSIALTYFAKRVGELSNGDISMKIFYAGSIVKGPTEIDALLRDIVDIGPVTLPYHAGQIPEYMRTTSMVPFVIDFNSLVWLNENTNWYKDYLKAIKLHLVYHAPAELVITMAKPIEDIMNPSLKGRKLRSPGLGYNEVIQTLGGDTIAMPSAEAPAAIATGLVSGLYTTLDTWDAEGLAPLCPYNYLLNTPFLTPHCMSDAGYNKLPDWAKKVIDQAGGETEKYMLDWARGYRDTILKKYKNDSKIHMVILNDDQMEAWEAKLKPFYDWLKGKYPEAKTYLEYCKKAWEATHKGKAK
jgi:TRAP-type C4-dicarboxylate transport system substrate-binding protein